MDVLSLLNTMADLVPHHEAELRQLLHPTTHKNGGGVGTTSVPVGTSMEVEGPAGAVVPPNPQARLQTLVASLTSILVGPSSTETPHPHHQGNGSNPNSGTPGKGPPSPLPAAAGAAAAAAAAVAGESSFSSSIAVASSPGGSVAGGNQVAPPRRAPFTFGVNGAETGSSSSATSVPGPAALVPQPLSSTAISALSRAMAAATVSAVSSVLSSTDLLHMVVGYLLTNAAPEEARATLNTLALVSKRFQRLAGWDLYWRPVATGLLPVLAVAETEGGGGSKALLVQAGYRDYLLKYGHCLLHRRAWMGEALEDGYTLSFEVWDAAEGNSLRMLSASGPIRVQIDQGGGFTSLRIGGAERREVLGPTFSAASRDPGLRRFNNMEDFFSQSHLPEFNSALSVRVTVTDERTGRMALLWSTKKDSAYLTEAPLAYWEPFLREGSISCFLDHWTPLQSGSYDGESMTVTIGFHVCPEPDQEDVPEQERLYRLAGGDADRYEEHQSYISITFMTLNTNGIHQFFRSLLKD